MAYWLFQGNPKYYKLRAAMRNFERMSWLVTRYEKDIAPGDGVLVWISGADAGIYAIAEVIEPATKLIEVLDIGYWLDKSKIGTRPQAWIRFTTKLLDKPLLRSHLTKDEVLKDLAMIKNPNQTNFKVSSDRWKRVYELLKE
ncbi:EVE domain-containing protein [Oxynema aestuarii]|uniref:EVE domain-containing protein n=1 Tax=Oxynema aestuarii AP17 TaxID=2064643 RepID=A0A6H1TYD3_9CYAN|nr:EVE domain-containing protein [Oxynema aestuarii]QIZ71415.1 EVE domain-containing protein [Oxynema aestuarii AP17]